jgi:hypothetical protein
MGGWVGPEIEWPAWPRLHGTGHTGRAGGARCIVPVAPCLSISPRTAGWRDSCATSPGAKISRGGSTAHACSSMGQRGPPLPSAPSTWPPYPSRGCGQVRTAWCQRWARFGAAWCSALPDTARYTPLLGGRRWGGCEWTHRQTAPEVNTVPEVPAPHGPPGQHAVACGLPSLISS